LKEESLQPNRRVFLGRVGVAGAATIAAGVIGVEPLLKTDRSQVQAAPAGSNQRANACAKLRREAANEGLQATPQNLQHPNNNDENLLIVKGHRKLAEAYVVHVMDVYDHYRWRWLRQEHGNNAFQGLKRTPDAWQGKYFSTLQREIAFWMS